MTLSRSKRLFLRNMHYCSGVITQTLLYLRNSQISVNSLMDFLVEIVCSNIMKI